MGVVYEAVDRDRDNPIALKHLRCVDPSAIFRFKHEFRSLADVSHRNLVCLHELVSTGSDWFFTMELIRGSDFLTFVRGGSLEAQPTCPDTPNQPFTATERTADTLSLPKPTLSLPPSAAELAASSVRTRVRGFETAQPPDYARLRHALPQLVEGVLALHCAGHLHRDIKPSNIMVEPTGRVVLLDFGVATELSQSLDPSVTGLVGTPLYMAPEQCAGDPLTPACDWYAVGAVLFEALTGQRPFTGSEREVMLAKRRRPAPSPALFDPAVPDDLRALCEELLDRDPARRPDGHQLLQRLAQSEPLALVADPPSEPAADPLVGREAELGLLTETLAATRRGAARLVVIAGGPGAGKSALLHQFRSQVGAQEDAVVLDGRCFEREFVPYKALDSVIDDLLTHLLELPRDQIPRLPPDNLRALGQLFPVLRRLASEPLLQIGITPDPHEQRKRGVRALRQLFHRLARRAPLVLCIDDVQWGDIDSALLLAEVMRGPDPPAILVLVTCAAEEITSSGFLTALLPHTPDVERIELAPLGHDQSLRLAHRLLEESGADGGDQAEVIAREAKGNPLFVADMVWFATAGDTTLHEPPLAFDEVIRRRVAELPVATRNLLEVIAVAGRPISRAVASRAAAVVDADQHLARLRVARLVRSSGPSDRDSVVVYHDRIREIIVDQLSDTGLRQRHEGLARSIEATGDGDPEALARHYQGAGHRGPAGRFAAVAGDQAFAALAFERAADNYQRALALAQLEPAEASRLRGKLGDALAHAGRGANAARAYLGAIADAPATRKLDYRRRAAHQLLTNGHLVSGLAVLRDALAAVGLVDHQGSRTALAGLALRRARLRLRGTQFRRRDEAEIPTAELERLEVCWSAVAGFAMCDVVRTGDFLTRYQLLALASGEPYRVALGLCAELVYSGGMGYRGRRRITDLLSQVEPLVDGCGTPHARGVLLAARAYAEYPMGHFRRSAELASEAAELLRDQCTGVTWELGVAEMAHLWSLYYLGRIHELGQRLPQLRNEARTRGDWFMATNLSTSILNSHWLFRDQVDQARAACREAMTRWPSSLGFLLQHYWEWIALAHADLYSGDPAAAWRRATACWPRLRRSRVLLLQIARVETRSLRARSALAAARAQPTQRRALLRTATRETARLGAEPVPITRPLTTLVRAGIAACSNRPEDALSLLSQAEAGFDAAAMRLHAACARYRRGQLIGGDSGRALMVSAGNEMRREEIAVPERIADVLAPGFATR